MTPMIIIGALLSFLGVALILGIVIYFVLLPLDSPLRVFLNSEFAGLPILIYGVILGGVISGIGLIVYLKSIRAGIVVTSGGYVYQAPPQPVRRSSPAKGVQKPLAGHAGKTGERGGSVVEEIEKEIEEILEAGPKPVVDKPPEPTPTIEVVSRASDIVCPHCGKINPIGLDKCEACGKKIFTTDAPDKSCPVCNAPLKLSQPISGDLFVCGICFSELRIPPKLQEMLNLK